MSPLTPVISVCHLDGFGRFIICFSRYSGNEGKIMDAEEMYRLIVAVKDIRGRCPVFKVGDKMVVESPKIVVDRTDNMCVHALGCMLSMFVPLSRGISFKKLGLATEEGEKGYVQCLDPGKPYTDGGTVLFEIRRERIQASGS